MAVQKSTYSHLGINRITRKTEALDPDLVKIDGRNLLELIEFALKYSRLVNYFDLNNDRNGDWESFFKSDRTLYLCHIASLSIDSESGRFSHLLRKLNAETSVEPKVMDFQALNQIILDQIVELDNWLKFFKSTPKNMKGEFAQALQRLISSKLSSKLTDFITCQEGFIAHGALPNNNKRKFEQLEIEWDSPQNLTPPFKYNDQKPVADNITDALPYFSSLLWEFAKARKNRINVAAATWKAELNERHDFSPDLGLYLTFLRLFEPLQENLNGLTKRHLDFYFKDGLKLQKLPARPDRANVYFDVNKSFDLYPLPKDTQLLAGKDSNGDDIVFQTMDDLLLSQAELSLTNTIFVARNEILDAGKSPETITGIYTNSSSVSKKGTNNSASYWATFGADQFGIPTSEREMTEANLGFALGSPILWLAAGERTIDISFYFSTDSYEAILKDAPENINSDDLQYPPGIDKLFDEGFNAYLSTEKEWLLIENIEYSKDDDQCCLTIKVFLDNDQPSIVGFNKKVLKDDIVSEFPVFKLMVNNSADQYPYSLVNGLVVEKATIEVDVKNFDQLSLVNDVSKIKPGKPFQPFQPTPITTGSGLMVGSAEFFQKRLTSLSFDIDWYNVPNLKGGFQEYYQAYNVEKKSITIPSVEIDNASFKVELSALIGGEWVPDNSERQQQNLFKFKKTNGQVAPATNIEVDLTKIKLKPDISIPQKLDYSIKSKTGFFRIELSSPSFAFAQAQYPVINAQIALYNAKLKMWSILPKKKMLLPMPNTPFVPQIKSIKASYSAKVEIDNSSFEPVNEENPASFFHYGPFTTYPVTFSEGPVGEGQKPKGFLFPEFEEEGHLFLGLSKLDTPQQLNLLFQLGDFKSQHTLLNPPSITWSYLVDDQWKKFGKNVLKDGTVGFTEAGIVSLDLPDEMTSDNTILPSGYYWIRISVDKDTAKLCDTLAINLNAVLVERVVSTQNNTLNNSLPAGSIKSMINKVSAVSKVVQPMGSFGGESAEEASEYYQRVSERLRHKQRTIDAWDYERMVLTRFSSVYATKCIRTCNTNHSNAPGNVLITLVPDPSLIPQNNPLEPRVSSELLNEVKAYLTSSQSPFIQLEITNPLYEEVQVDCAVQFKKGYNNGFYLNKLDEAIKQFISPWISGNMSELVIGGSISALDISNMIERLPYVQFVTGLSMTQTINDDGYYTLNESVEVVAQKIKDLGNVVATKPWSVLTSASSHRIEMLTTEKSEPPKVIGVNKMVIDDDFIV